MADLPPSSSPTRGGDDAQAEPSTPPHLTVSIDSADHRIPETVAGLLPLMDPSTSGADTSVFTPSMLFGSISPSSGTGPSAPIAVGDDLPDDYWDDLVVGGSSSTGVAAAERVVAGAVVAAVEDVAVTEDVAAAVGGAAVAAVEDEGAAAVDEGVAAAVDEGAAAVEVEVDLAGDAAGGAPACGPWRRPSSRIRADIVERLSGYRVRESVMTHFREIAGGQGMREGAGGSLPVPDYPGGPHHKKIGGFSGGNHPAVITSTTVDVVPRALVPSIYGEDGGCLRRIQEISEAKITVTEPRPEATETVIIISGTPEQTHAAQSLIQAFVLRETSAT